MIIELDRSITSNLTDLSDSELLTLTAIATSRARGFNFVIANKRDLLAMSEFIDLGKPARAIFRKIYNDQTQWANALSTFGFKVRIVKQNTVIKEVMEDGVKTITISLQQSLDYKVDDKPSIIAENLTDIKFYTAIVKSYLASIRFGNMNISYHPVNGGGGTTKDVVETHYNECSGISLCLLDSDIESPWLSYGNTAQNVIDIIPEQPYARYVVTHSREAENIIPLKILDHFGSNNSSLRSRIDKFKKLSEVVVQGNMPIKYVDFKKGIKNHLLKCDCPTTKQFWYDSFVESGIIKTCNNTTPCTSMKKCTCFLADGLGTDLLKSTVAYLTDNNFDYQDIDAYMKTEWDHICKEVSSYIIAPNKAVS
ncbi:hypothetical protein AB4289_10030 [Vibrio cyclitrophicus]|uniref:hypothetical protein n=1 Tax=Vibrio cyclitrophicus TaxID=47951 RepID=UPI0007EEBA4B|nr:hypothetical protein [Vibrio cyclitrophicus]OBT29453.1 hypothetical protein A9263_05175 [Vibrio cyclitrophicus]